MSLITRRLNTFLLALVVLMAAAIIGILATRAGAGSLDPPAAPASTMHTLDDVLGAVQNTQPIWDQRFDSTNGSTGPIPPAGCGSDRFRCVMGFKACPACQEVYPAVLDEETGLVWQRSPAAIASDWFAASVDCAAATTGQRGGWRLPTSGELSSLLTTTLTLPAGNPFTNVPTELGYWTSSDDGSPQNAVAVSLAGSAPMFRSRGDAQYYWCVRGDAS